MTQPQLAAPETGRKRRRFGIVGGLGMVMLIALGSLGLLWAIGALLIVSDPLKEADAIVLLSGGDDQRWAEAAKLYQQKIAPVIILTETDQTIGDTSTPYNLLVENNISALGVPKGDIFFTQTVSETTVDESHSVLAYLQDKGYQSCVIVTDPFHTFRTRLIFRDTFRGSGIQVAVHSVQGHWYRSATWFLSARGWQATISELASLFGYGVGLRW